MTARHIDATDKTDGSHVVKILWNENDGERELTVRMPAAGTDATDRVDVDLLPVPGEDPATTMDDAVAALEGFLGNSQLTHKVFELAPNFTPFLHFSRGSWRNTTGMPHLFPRKLTFHQLALKLGNFLFCFLVQLFKLKYLGAFLFCLGNSLGLEAKLISNVVGFDHRLRKSFFQKHVGNKFFIAAAAFPLR